MLDWLGATVIWSFVSIASGVILSEGMGAPEELGVMLCFGMLFSGVVGARLWWLRRPVDPAAEVAGRVGLTTDEMAAQRLAEMESRIYELEERVELTERLLARAEGRPALPVGPRGGEPG